MRSRIMPVTSVSSLAAPSAPRATAAKLRLCSALAALLLTCAGAALAAPAASALTQTARDAARSGPVSDVPGELGVKGSLNPFDQHGSLFGHLPPVRENTELVSKFNLIHPGTGQPVLEGQIADVAVHKGYAYLNSWDSATCVGGGTFIVDIRNPASPKQVGFIAAQAPFYHGEGAHVISVDTPQFKGDLLAVNDETYGSNVTGTCSTALDKSRGGFDLYDVTNPAAPVTLVQGAGDRSPESSLTQDPAIAANSYHSVFVWQDGPRAFLVASDNTELSDVDIFDITDPRDPEFIEDLDPVDLPEGEQIVGESAYGNAIFHHDVVVKRIGGQVRMLVSFWDAGYLQLNVTDPANPTYITDTNFDDPDPLTGIRPARRQRPPGGVLARQPVRPGRRRGLRSVPPDQHDHAGAVGGSAVHVGAVGRRANRRRGVGRRRHGVRRQRVHGHRAGAAGGRDDRGRRARRLRGRLPGEGRRDRRRRL